MIVLGTLLLVLLVISEGRTKLDCKCADDSKECKEQCAIDNRSARDIHCTQDALPSNQCDEVINGSYCNNYRNFVGLPVTLGCDQSDDRCLWKPCCFEGMCPISRDYVRPVGSIKADNVTFSWSLYNGVMPKLLISWSQALPVGAYQLFITTTDATDLQPFTTYLDRCTCLNPSIREYSTTVGENFEEKLIQIKLVSWPDDTSIFDDSHVVTKILTVPGCWTLEGADPEKCPKVPTAPQNLTVTGIPMNESVVMLWISWEPPAAYLPDIMIYRIIIYTHTQVYYLYTNGSALQYSAIVEVSTTTYQVAVAASNSHELTEDHQFCNYVPENCDTPPCAYYCWGVSAYTSVNNTEITTPTYAPTTIETSISSGKKQTTITTLVAVLSGSGALLLLITVAVVLLTCRACLPRRLTVYNPLTGASSQTPSPILSAKVFIINSPQSSDEDLRLVRNLCHNLADNAVEPITYEYSMCESGPEQSGIYQWMENNFIECNMILFVCNKSFYDAWYSNESEQNPIISASRQLLQGHLTSSENISKLAVVLLRETDQQYVPSLYLKNVTTFVVFSDGHCNEEDLVRYILQVPRFIKPAVLPATPQHIAVLTENIV